MNAALPTYEQTMVELATTFFADGLPGTQFSRLVRLVKLGAARRGITRTEMWDLLEEVAK
jgi:hypothetical protein